MLVGVVLETVVTTFIKTTCIALLQDGAGRVKDCEQLRFIGEASHVTGTAWNGIHQNDALYGLPVAIACCIEYTLNFLSADFQFTARPLYQRVH